MSPTSVGIVPFKVLYERSNVAVEWRIKTQNKHEHTYMSGQIGDSRKQQQDSLKLLKRPISDGIVPVKVLYERSKYAVELRIKLQDKHEHTYMSGQIGDSRKQQQDSLKLLKRPISDGIVPLRVLLERSKVAVEWRIKLQDKHEHTYMPGQINRQQ